MRYLRLSICIILITNTFSCSEDFLTKYPIGVLSENLFYNERGVELLLIGAYSLIDGVGAGNPGNVGLAVDGAVSNWLWGSVASDDAYLGGPLGSGYMWTIEEYTLESYSTACSNKWITNYVGITRCNAVLRVLAKTKDISESKRAHIKAQALFLRAWFHFELKRVFNNIPYITENVKDPAKVTNTIDAWPLIENDLLYSVSHLPESQAEVGRSTKYAAMAVLARVYLFQEKYDAAKSMLDGIINSGMYELVESYHDNYRIATNNNKESIFEIQYSVNDGTGESFNGGYGDAYNFPHAGDIGLCCGFHPPSQNLVNAFKVNANGIPLLDSYNDSDLKNDMGAPSASFFIPPAASVDPRIDWTVGRRGIPYLDWGINRGDDWIREQSNEGPYVYVKNMFYKSERHIYSTATGWATGLNANNYRAYRYAHILLWRAEVAVEENDLSTALTYVNMIRNRAANHVVMGLCSTYQLPEGVVPVVDMDQPAANYDVQPYPSFPDQEYARKAVRMEIRLEFAMEGHRFFDLVRWGIAAETLNAYIERDMQFRSYGYWIHVVVFTEGQDEYRPIPQSAIEMAGEDENGEPLLIQNPGY